jgi:hypothetical protein
VGDGLARDEWVRDHTAEQVVLAVDPESPRLLDRQCVGGQEIGLDIAVPLAGHFACEHAASQLREAFPKDGPCTSLVLVREVPAAGRDDVDRSLAGRDTH